MAAWTVRRNRAVPTGGEIDQSIVPIAMRLLALPHNAGYREEGEKARRLGLLHEVRLVLLRNLIGGVCSHPPILCW